MADIDQILQEAKQRWLRPNEILEILRNYQRFKLAPEPPIRPAGCHCHLIQLYLLMIVSLIWLSNFCLLLDNAAKIFLVFPCWFNQILWWNIVPAYFLNSFSFLFFFPFEESFVMIIPTSKFEHWLSLLMHPNWNWILFAFQLVRYSCLIEKPFDIFVKMVIAGGRKKMEKLLEKLMKSWRCAVQFTICKFTFLWSVLHDWIWASSAITSHNWITDLKFHRFVVLLHDAQAL